MKTRITHIKSVRMVSLALTREGCSANSSNEVRTPNRSASVTGLTMRGIEPKKSAVRFNVAMMS